jgi:ubiquinone/menaquinone biosynthesis C-methylase UbiE
VSTYKQPDSLKPILALYTRLADDPSTDFGWGKGPDNARALGYAEDWLERLPAIVWESSAAVGNPFAVSPINSGSTVLDLGCGAGADACIAALLVGDQGAVIGLDCTPAMVTKARANAATAGLGHTRFQQADIDSGDLPLADGSVDVIISNGAINLANDKARVLAEAFRVLRPGGRMQIADMVKDPAATTECCAYRSNNDDAAESWADCVSGTLAPETFVELLIAAGFKSAELVSLTGYRTAPHTVGALFRAHKP